MSKRVVILEDDTGYEQLMRNLMEGRGWEFRIGGDFSELSGSIDWADVAVVDLDAANARECLVSLRTRRPDLAVIGLGGAPDTDATSLGLLEIVEGLPGTLIEAVQRATAPPPNVIDLTAKSGEAVVSRPWYMTS